MCLSLEQERIETGLQEKLCCVEPPADPTNELLLQQEL